MWCSVIGVWCLGGAGAAGFPGIDVEFEKVLEFFESAYGGVVLDMSCGSGWALLFCSLFACATAVHVVLW